MRIAINRIRTIINVRIGKLEQMGFRLPTKLQKQLAIDDVIRLRIPYPGAGRRQRTLAYLETSRLVAADRTVDDHETAYQR